MTAGGENIKCPFCREEFGAMDQLRQEHKNAGAGLRPSQRNTVISHPGTSCRGCTQSPITGKCYRYVCYLLILLQM